MTFSTTLVKRTVLGNTRCHYGTWVNQSGDTGGTIQPGLTRIEDFEVGVRGVAIAADQVAINADFPVIPGSASGIVIVVGSGVSGGVWKAWGRN